MRLGFALVALGVLAAPAAADTSAYSFYPTAVEGSARNVGLGGASLAYPKDYSAVFVNPAGLGGLAGDGIDFGSDSSSIDNFVVDTSNPSSKAVNDPIKFSFYGLRYVSPDGWGWGFAAQTPYQFDDLFNGTTKVIGKKSGGGTITTTGLDQTEIQALTHIYSVAVAKTYLDKRLSLGMTVNYIQATERYDFTPVFATTAPVHLSATNDALSADLGLLARPAPWLQVAAVYKMGYRVAFDPARNNKTTGTRGNTTAFRDAETPDRLSLGLAWLQSRYFRAFVSGDLVIPTKNTVVVGSGLSPTGNDVLRVGATETLDGHWGLEFIPVDEPDLTVRFWGGGYFEDTAIQGGYRRYHRTAGLAFEPWFLNFNVADDDSELYNNFTIGVGVDILGVASRISKTTGWGLPIQ